MREMDGWRREREIVKDRERKKEKERERKKEER